MATIMDPVPLIPRSPSRAFAARRPRLRSAAHFLRGASLRRMREPSLLVRESAAEQLEERQSDWAYSRPVVFLDCLWNLSFVAVAFGFLILSADEIPSMPLRVWILGYALQCVVHMVCLCLEFRKRAGSLRGFESGDGEDNASVAKHLESANTMFSFIWWIIGFYWISIGGQTLTRDAPQLYWLCIVFLAFDVFFVVFCVALACVIGFAVCCCLPCIIAILYAVADQQEGASDEDIRQLPKYKFRRMGDPENFTGEITGPCGGIMTECGSDPPIEHVLSADNAECCICLSAYDDGAELRELSCSHHFHCACIDKWLYINATCPLCKYNIAKSNNNGSEEV